MNQKKTEAIKAGRELGEATARATAAGAMTASPSKITTQVGRYIGEGLIIGMEAMESATHNAGVSMARSAIDPMKEAVDRVSDNINDEMNLNPTITPVLDTSLLQNGMGMVDQMFGNRSMALAATNGMNSGKVTYSTSGPNSDSSSSVVSELELLRSEVNGLSELITKVKVQLDSGALVGQLVRPMDEALGRRASMAGRGVI